MKGTVVHAILLSRKKSLVKFDTHPVTHLGFTSQMCLNFHLESHFHVQGAMGFHLESLHLSCPPPPNLFQRLLTLPFITSPRPGVKTGTSPQTPRPCLLLSSSWQTSSIHRASIVNILGFADHVNFVAITQLCHCGTKASTDYMGKNGMHVFQ